jgi:hypothetical protein
MDGSRLPCVLTKARPCLDDVEVPRRPPGLALRAREASHGRDGRDQGPCDESGGQTTDQQRVLGRATGCPGPAGAFKHPWRFPQ